MRSRGEGLKQKEAFEYYYILGSTRTLEQVAKRFGVVIRTAERWSSTFNWFNRVRARDAEIGKRIEKRTNETVLEAKVKARKDIQYSQAIIKALILTFVTKLKNKEIEVTSIRDFSTLVVINTKLIEMSLQLSGGADKADQGDIETFTEGLRANKKLKEEILRIMEKRKKKK